MGNQLTQHKDYHWSYTDEPHASRRKVILAKYPQIKELYGYDWRTKYIVLFWILSQYVLAYFATPHLSWPAVFLLAYSWGGIAAHTLFLAMHEISHNLLFQSPVHNRLFGVFTNLATIFPHFSLFQKYHMEHHQYQGVEGIDADIPSRWEGAIFRHWITKLVWVILQPLFYISRPLFVKPKTPGFWEAVNWLACVAFAVFVYHFWGAKAVTYLVMSGVLGAGLHPVAGHFIAEHYVFVLGHETYSYLGVLNWICFNVGYHNEHHDFPRVPGTRLPEIRKIASEFYEDLPQHGSWVRVMVDYIFDKRVGPFSRVMRKTKHQ
jgi:sphingolipid delta-4 desaturase